MQLAYIFLLPFLGAACDRLRGWSGGPGKFPACYTWGVFMAPLFDLPWWGVPLFGFAWWMGAMPGWGWPEGYAVHGISPAKLLSARVPHPEWWQFWKLPDMPYTSLVIRGAMWPLPVLPLAYFDLKILLTLSMAFWMPLCIWVRGWLIRRFGFRFGGSMEAVRGFLFTYTLVMLT